LESKSPKKIAFIRRGTSHPTCINIIEALEKYFPDFDVEIINVRDLIKENKIIIFVNMFFLVKEYGLQILVGKKKFRKSFFKTTYIFKQIKRLVSKHLSKNHYSFSFQFQSFFDSSHKGLPHFAYIDHTHLANLCNPYFDRNELYSDSWVKLEKSIYQNAKINFTRSTNITKSLVEQYSCNPEQVVCVYRGSNTSENKKTPDKKPYRSKSILFVGIDWERKGGPELVEAFKLVLKEHPDAKLTIVGCSPEINVPNCNVVGRISLDEISRYYENASVFCLPTKSDPFPSVLVEALMHKLPVVSTNIEAIPDIILDGENGYLREPDDVEQLAQVLIDLIDDPKKCEEFGERGYQLAKERYTWDKVGEKIKKHVEAVIN